MVPYRGQQASLDSLSKEDTTKTILSPLADDRITKRFIEWQVLGHHRIRIELDSLKAVFPGTVFSKVHQQTTDLATLRGGRYCDRLDVEVAAALIGHQRSEDFGTVHGHRDVSICNQLRIVSQKWRRRAVHALQVERKRLPYDMGHCIRVFALRTSYLDGHLFNHIGKVPKI